MAQTNKPKKSLAGIKKEKPAQNPPKASQPVLTNQSVFKEKSKDIERGLKKIYQDSSGKMPNMSNIEFKKRKTITTVVVFFILALVIIFGATFLGFLVFQPKHSFTDDRVNLEIKGPFTVISGEEVSYTIKVSNFENISLSNVQLDVYLPVGFIFSTSNIPAEQPLADQEPLTYSNIKTWQLNDLYGNKTKEIEISGQLIGQPETKQTISANVSYLPANFSSEFQKNVNFNTEITSSLVSFIVNSPNQAASEEEAEFTVSLTNNSETVDLTTSSLELTFPLNFDLISSQIINQDNQPEEIFEEDQNAEEKTNSKIWLINSLPTNSQKQVKFTGKFTAAETKTENLTLTLKLPGPQNNDIIQQQEDISIEIIKGELFANLIIAGSNQNQPVNFGETLNYLLSVKNKSKTALGDVKIRAVINSVLLDWTSLKDDNNGQREEQQILWTKEQIPDLNIMLPEEEIEINFSIKLLDYQAAKKYNPSDYQVQSFFEAQIGKVDNSVTEVITNSNTIINEVNTNLGFSLDARYFDDDNHTLGTGPLPPVVGQKTSYRIYWTITNNLHEIRNIQVITNLPKYVGVAEQIKTSTGTLELKTDHSLSWQINRIPESINQATAEFDIFITPKENDIDKILTLLSEIKISALDAKTNGQLELSFQGITTSLETDPLAKGKGLIQAE